MSDIPSFIHGPLVDDKGELTPSWQLAFSQLFGQLQIGISNEGGYQTPTKTSDELTQLIDNVPNGTHFYDVTNKTPVVKKNGTFVPYG